MNMKTLFAGIFTSVVLSACSGNEIDARATLLAACDTKQGIGWLKKQYGEQYCECWADQAHEVLAEENYSKLVKATSAELAAADKAEREKIYREHTHLYATVSEAAGRCARGRAPS